MKTNKYKAEYKEICNTNTKEQIAELLNKFMLELCEERNILVMNAPVGVICKAMDKVFLESSKLYDVISGIDTRMEKRSIEAQEIVIKTGVSANNFLPADPFQTLEGIVDLLQNEYFVFYKVSINMSGQVVLRFSNTDINGNKKSF